MTISEAIEAFLKVAGKDSNKTRLSYETGLNHFLSFLDEVGVSPTHDVSRLVLSDARDFAGWLSSYRNPQTGHSLSTDTRSLYILIVSLFYRRLILDKYVGETWLDYVNYRAALGLKKSVKPLEKKLPPDELIKAMLETTNLEPQINNELSPGDQERQRLIWLRNRAIIHVLYSSGMRVGELVNLRRGDLRPMKQGMWVVGKGDKTRFVMITKEAWQVLHIYLDTRDKSKTGNATDLPLFAQHSRQAGDKVLSLSTRSIERIVTNIAEQTGLSEEFGMHPHAFRHYFATRFIRKTGDLALTQDALGHADPSTTRIYAQPSEEAYIKAHKETFGNG